MRKIKYDIILWDGKDPKTIEHYNLEEAVKEDFVKLHPLRGHDKSVIVREWTGLKDKNGKEIYEGDITNYGVVKWFDKLHWDGGGSMHSGFYFEGVDEKAENIESDLDYHTSFDEDIEVIGNIYEQV